MSCVRKHLINCRTYRIAFARLSRCFRDCSFSLRRDIFFVVYFRGAFAENVFCGEVYFRGAFAALSRRFRGACLLTLFREALSRSSFASFRAQLFSFCEDTVGCIPEKFGWGIFERCSNVTVIGVHPGLNRCPFKNPKDPRPESPCCARLLDAARWCLRRFGALWCSLVRSAPGTRKKTRVSSKHRSLRNFGRKLCFTSLHSQPQALVCISLLRFLRGSVLLFSCPRGLGPLLILFSFCRRSPPDQERSFQHKKSKSQHTSLFGPPSTTFYFQDQ